MRPSLHRRFPHATWNSTKIVATIGPASAKRGVLRQMMQAGRRLPDQRRPRHAGEHRAAIALIRDVAKRLGIAAAVLVDLPGPKYRVGRLARSRSS